MTPESAARAYCANTQTIRGAIEEEWLSGLLAEIDRLRGENAKLREVAERIFYNEKQMRHHGQIKDTQSFDECRSDLRKARDELRKIVMEKKDGN